MDALLLFSFGTNLRALDAPGPELRRLLGPSEHTLVQVLAPASALQICRGTDWAAVETLARRLGLLERLALRAEEFSAAGAPPAMIERWVDARRARAACNLLLAREESAVLEALRRSRIEAFPLKGVSLARILHWDVSARAVLDIDLGVRSVEVARAADILEQRGYTFSLPHALLGDSAFLHNAGEHTAEAVCVREQAGFSLLVELHWKVLPLPEDSLWSSLTEYGDARVGEPPVRTLAPDLYLLYLCAHVSGHGWTSLRWLCDVADFLVRFAPRIEPAQFVRHCAASRLRHRVGTTLELLEAYFGLCWPPVETLRNARTRRTATEFLLRPFTPALSLSPGAVHRERLRVQDNSWEQLRYLWWLAHPTRTELVRREGGLRSRPGAWLLRAVRLVQLACEGSFFRGQEAPRRGVSIPREETVL